MKWNNIFFFFFATPDAVFPNDASVPGLEICKHSWSTGELIPRRLGRWRPCDAPRGFFFFFFLRRWEVFYLRRTSHSTFNVLFLFIALYFIYLFTFNDFRYSIFLFIFFISFGLIPSRWIIYYVSKSMRTRHPTFFNWGLWLVEHQNRKQKGATLSAPRAPSTNARVTFEVHRKLRFYCYSVANLRILCESSSRLLSRKTLTILKTEERFLTSSYVRYKSPEPQCLDCRMQVYSLNWLPRFIRGRDVSMTFDVSQRKIS